MAVEAFVGLVGGGKSYNSVRRMMSYMAIGGRCCSNILLKGYNESAHTFHSDSPVLSFLRSLGWEYQEGQYTFISFDDMVSNPSWVSRVPAGIDRDHRTLLVIDEATDLFDSLDGGRLRVDSSYRELFHFLRLSRHVHVDVLFVVQDINSINARLKGLVSYIWRSTDMKSFRLPKFKIPFPFNLFMLQQFDRSGRFEVKREWVKKDSRVFTLYDSEAFNNSLSVKWDGVAISKEDGKKIKGGNKKMNTLQKLLLFLSLGLSVWAFFRPARRSSGSTVSSSVVTNVVVSCSTNFVSLASSITTNSSTSDVRVVRGRYRYNSRSAFSDAFVVFNDSKLKVGFPCEYGFVRSVSSDFVMCDSFDGGVVYLVPVYESPPIDSASIVIRRAVASTPAAVHFKSARVDAPR